MIEVYGNLWEHDADWRGITTNATIKNNGEIVMGRGCAREAKEKYRHIPTELATVIRLYGNDVHWFHPERLFSFPVKHNWWEQADFDLIKKSAYQLNEVAKYATDKTFLLPKPGCGNGGLRWEDVRPLIKYLPDNVLIIDFKENT